MWTRTRHWDAGCGPRRRGYGSLLSWAWPGAPILPAVRRGILGGTFDPPHLAHLLAGEAAYRDLALDVVTFVPAGAPWQKAGDEVSEPEHRWQMTVRAVHGVDYFEADDREVRRPGWTYTIDTIDEFGADSDLVLVLGGDAARGLRSWHRWEELLERVTLAVAPRPGTTRIEVEQGVGAPLVWLDMPLVNVSGAAIRARARQGKSIRFMVPEAVWEYVAEHRLYD